MMKWAFCDKNCLSFTGNCEPLEVKSFICLSEAQNVSYIACSCNKCGFLQNVTKSIPVNTVVQG